MDNKHLVTQIVDTTFGIQVTFLDQNYDVRPASGSAGYTAFAVDEDTHYRIMCDFPVNDPVTRKKYEITGSHSLQFLVFAPFYAGDKPMNQKLVETDVISTDNIRGLIDRDDKTAHFVTFNAPTFFINTFRSNEERTSTTITFVTSKNCLHIHRVETIIPKPIADLWYKRFVHTYNQLSNGPTFPRDDNYINLRDSYPL